MKKVLCALFVTLFCFGIFSPVVFAATEEDTYGFNSFATDVTAEDIDVEQTPDFPGAFTTVNFRLSSNATDLNRYRINWTVNGTSKKAGIGERDFSVKTGAFGQPLVIGITVSLPSGPVTKTIRLAPEDATLLWEAIDSTVPPFYKGKKLPAPEAIIKLTAIPNFRSEGNRSIRPENAVYIWERNGEILTTSGGYGKNSVTLRHNKLRSTENIDVRVSSLENTYTAETRSSISFFTPETLFYQKNESSGLWNVQPQRTFLLQGDSMRIKAVPFYLSRGLASGDRSLTANWTMNGSAVDLLDQDRPLELVLQNPGYNGQAQFGLTTTNQNYALQEANGGFTATFIK